VSAWVPGRAPAGGVKENTTAPSEPGATPAASRAICASSPTISTGRGAVAAVPHHDAHLEPRADGNDGPGNVELGLPARAGSHGEEGEGEEAREAGQR
jgi:hypothetical protein